MSHAPGATPTANLAPGLTTPLAPSGGLTANGRYQPIPQPPTPASATPSGHQPLGGRLLRQGFGAYYLAVALVAAAGQVSSALHWSGWHLLGVVPLVVVLEFGGVVMAARADERRRMGERAYAALAIATAVAAMAATINYAGHAAVGQTIAAWVFAGMTVLGYTIWLVDTGYRRRDAMRAAGSMRPTRPAYGWRWRRPRITLLALELWRKDQERLRRREIAPAAAMSVDESWALARVARQTKREMRRGGDHDGYANLAPILYDVGRVAETARAMVDHEALARRIADGVAVDRVAASIAASTARRWRLAPGSRRRTAAPASANPVSAPAPVSAPDPAPTVAPPAEPAATRQGGERPKRRRPTAKRAAGGGKAPSLEQLVATLGERHPGEPVSLADAATTLRKVYGRCSDVRARAARDGHNERLAGNGDQESEAVAV